MKSKYKMYVIVGICIMLVGMIVMLSSYALWRVKETQTGENVVNGACLGFTLVEEESDNNLITGFTLEDAWPISDEEGKSLKGYTFKLENTCDKAIDYEIVLESLKTEKQNYFDNSYIKIQLDNKEIQRYSELETVSNDVTAEYANDIRESKHLYSGTIQKHVEDSLYNIKTHTIRIWISEDSPNSEIGKEFKSKIKVYAGQLQIPPEHKLSDEECFRISNNAVGYYNIEKCGTELVLPATINGIPIERISLYNKNGNISSSLTYVNLENAIYLKEIGDLAFIGYVGTGKELIIPNSVTKIGVAAFQGYNGTKIVLGDNVQDIKASAFIYYYGTKEELIIPDSVINIEAAAFSYYNGSKLVLGNSVETIGSLAFNDYEGLNQDLIIPDSVLQIGDNTFGEFQGRNLILGKNIEEIGSMAFWRYNNASFTIPSSINKLGTRSFYEFTGTININMSEEKFNGLKDIDENWKNANATLNYLVD